MKRRWIIGRRRPCELLILKLGFENREQVVDGVFLKIGFVDNRLAVHRKDIFGCNASDALESVDNPCVNFVLEFVKIDIIVEVFAVVAVYVDYVACEFGGKFDVECVLADGEGTSSGRRNTSARFSSSLRRIDEIFAGLSARWINNSVFLVNGITSMFSLRSSRTMPWIREPFTPTHAPTGSMWSS